MCARYDPVTHPDRFKKVFGTALPENVGTTAKGTEVFPGGWAPIVRATPEGLASGVITSSTDEPAAHEAVWARFGLIPSWAKDTKICRSTYNARTETISEKPSFKEAWVRHQHCIVPAEVITEPDYRTGKATPARIACADGLPMGIAGLWSEWQDPQGQTVNSFTMLTVNADDHALMKQFHKPDDEKRMVVILPRGSWKDWLLASPHRTTPQQRQAMIRAYPSERMCVSSAAS